MNYIETLEYLFKQLPMFQRQGKSAFKKDLTNTIALCNILQNPQTNFKSIHVAGTNGKGSTSHLLSSVLQEAGYKVGLYTSPHLKDFRERIRINGVPIAEKKIIDFVSEYDLKFESISPSFFEWTVALAFHTFSVEKVDIAIIETGLGGRLDSTNIIIPELSVITNIGYDHVDMLGDTIEKIALEKAGIIKETIPVIVGEHSDAEEIFLEKANELNAPITIGNYFTLEKTYETDLLGNYQSRNIKTAFLALKNLIQQGWNINEENLQNGFLHVVQNTGLRGRWEILQENPTVIAETAHNEDGIKLALEQLNKTKPNTIHFVLGFVADKNIDSILQLFPKQANYYFCQAKVPRALNHFELQVKANSFSLKGNSFFTVEDAVTEAKKTAKPLDTIYIGGSNFVVAEAL